MKSRITPKLDLKPTLIGYCIAPEKVDALKAAAKENTLELSFIGTESAGETLGFLSGIKSAVRTGIEPQNPPMCEVLIMAGLKSSTIDHVLALLRKRNAAIDLKCILTPINQYWNILTLVDELKKEHEAMKK